MAEPLHILKKYFGYNSFRPVQEDIISSVLRGQDTLALLPTGGGKSICFQIPGLILEGITIVVSPLIALMKDQVAQLQERGISAVALHAGQSKKEIDFLLDNVINSEVKFLYCSPERLQSELFKVRLKRMVETRGVSLIAIDEAHCISQWGYDFRPSYLKISELREELPDVPVIALTATATPRVKKDIQEKLSFQRGKVFTKSFERKNLSYSVRFEEHKERKLLEILQKVNGSAVIYVSTRRHAKEVAEMLVRNHISADFYHAGLNHQDRHRKQENWIHNRTRVIVSTNAFGMGIDKSDVRVVIHMDLPQNLESYYQEAGRAGRDERKAFAVIITNQKDIEDLRQKVAQSLPSIELLKATYQMLGNYFQLATGSFPEESLNFELADFAKKFDKHPIEIFHALKSLQDQGLIHLSESFYQPAKLRFSLSQSKMYEFQIANAHHDAIIKSVLRLYGGEIFQQSVSIQETNVAAIVGKTTQEVKQQLQYLAENGVVDYVAQKDGPQLTFLVPKQDVSSLQTNEQQLKEKRKLKLDKLESIISYLHRGDVCRTRQLLNYFGEQDYDNCEVCDVCVEARLHADDESLREKYKLRIFNVIKENDELNEEKLVQLLAPTRKEIMLDLLATLIDHGELRYNEFGFIRLNRTEH